MRKDLLEQAGVLDFMQRLVGCHQRALKSLHDNQNIQIWDTTRAARPHMFHCLVMDEAKAEFADDADIHYHEDRQLRTLRTPWFEVRVKKVSGRFSAVALNRTFRTSMWVQMPLREDLSPLSKVVVGYSVTKNWAMIDEVAFLELKGKRIIDRIVIPMDIPDLFQEHTGGFIEADFRIKPDSIKRTRQEEMDLRELNSGNSEAGGE